MISSEEVTGSRDLLKTMRTTAENDLHQSWVVRLEFFLQAQRSRTDVLIPM